jgi:GT2 family glycosyltransferase
MPDSATRVSTTDAPARWEGPVRGSAVVCIPVYGAYKEFAQCLASVLATTAPDVGVFVADDSSQDPAIARLIEQVNEARQDRVPIQYHCQERNVGFVHNVNDALRRLAPADVIVLNSDCVVADGWYEGLRRAAYSDTRVATASPLTNHGTIVSIPDRNQPQPALPQDWSLEQAAAAVRATSPAVYPTLPSAIGHCMYLRRSALELVGEFDEAFAPGYEEEVDLSQRCIRQGMSHVLADDVLVLHHGGSSFDASGSAAALREEHHNVIVAKYPYWDRWVADVESAQDTPLARSLAAGRRALLGTAVTIDGRILTRFLTGTQLHVLEIIVALHEPAGPPLRVIVPHDLGEYATKVFADLPNVRLISEAQAVSEPSSDVVHRPYQVSSLEDFRLLLAAGQRLVITHQDLIAFNNPAYHDTYDRWHEHRELTKTALTAADRVAFFSRHARREAVREQLVEPERASVVLLGSNHRLTELRPEAKRPRGARRLAGKPFLLCLGTDFVHKNRRFAIRLLDALRTKHGFEGELVFAGPHVAGGSSAGDEAEELVTNPRLDEHVLDLAAVEESGKRWLMENATALVYPSVYEGFGLVPFEAAEVGVPCLFAPEAALGELFPPEAAALVPWDPEASAERCAPLLDDPDARNEHVRLLRAAAAPLTWTRTGHELRALYRAAVEAPPRSARGAVGELVDLRLQMRQLTEQGTYDPHLLALMGTSGTIPADLRRPLLAIASRPLLRALLFGPLRVGYRLSRVVLRRG